MTIRELAMNWIENADTTPTLINAETAAQYIEWMDSDDLPDNMSPEAFADAWNSIIREGKTMVVNKEGAEVDYNAAVDLMDDEIREELAGDEWDSEQDFFTAYEEAHERKFGDEWELSKQNPTY